MKRSNGRRVMLTFLLALGPFGLACEAVLDFDRTPLQEELEAGADAGSRDGSADGGTRRPDSSTPRDSGGQQPVDAGSDAEGGV